MAKPILLSSQTDSFPTPNTGFAPGVGGEKKINSGVEGKIGRLCLWLFLSLMFSNCQKSHKAAPLLSERTQDSLFYPTFLRKSLALKMPLGLDSLVTRFDTACDASYGIFNFDEESVAKASHHLFVNSRTVFFHIKTYLSIDTVGRSISEGTYPGKIQVDSIVKRPISEKDWVEIKRYFDDTDFWNLLPNGRPWPTCGACCSYGFVFLDASREDRCSPGAERHSVLRSYCSLAPSYLDLVSHLKESY